MQSFPSSSQQKLNIVDRFKIGGGGVELRKTVEKSMKTIH